MTNDDKFDMYLSKCQEALKENAPTMSIHEMKLGTKYCYAGDIMWHYCRMRVGALQRLGVLLQDALGQEIKAIVLDEYVEERSDRFNFNLESFLQNEILQQ